MNLYESGIQNESANIRAHVGVLAGKLFIFKRQNAVDIMKDYVCLPGYQPGVSEATALGYIVPPNDIEGMAILDIPAHYLEGFHDNLSTSEKGNRAVAIVMDCIAAGKFPFSFNGEFVIDKDIQISGTDIIVKANIRIEVKCDYKASVRKGAPDKRCTGNLYIQIAESNPLKRY